LFSVLQIILLFLQQRQAVLGLSPLFIQFFSSPVCCSSFSFLLVL
jgi:hypothetical protein